MTNKQVLDALDNINECAPYNSQENFEFHKNFDVIKGFIEDICGVLSGIISDVSAPDNMLEKGLVCGMSLQKQLLIIKARGLINDK